MHASILYELGIVLLVGFFTAILMKKLHQSVITGYMIAGLLIGPNVLGLVGNTELVGMLSELGIVFLMFFLGLEFSIVKFKRVKNSVLFIGTYEIIVNLIIGLLLGTILGLVFKEKLFLAVITALSSSGVVAKLLFEMKRTASKEAEVLMGVMIYEDFIAIILLGILSGLAVFDTVRPETIALALGKSAVFYAAFIIMGILIINTFTDKILMRIDSQELFTALIMGLILLVGAFAAKIGLASAAGAFLLGMIINSYEVEERLHRTVSAFKDIFLIVFFISFGMLLNPREIPGILWIVAIIVPISVLAEIFATSSAAFFSGFSSKNAVSIGTSMIARGEYSLVIASMGYGMGVISGDLYQFTGVYVFCMTLLAPMAMKNSSRIQKLIISMVPRFLRYGAKLVSLTMRPILLPEEAGVKLERKFVFFGGFMLYLFVVTGAFIATSLYVIIPLALLGLVVVYQLRKLFISGIKKVEKQIHFHEIHEGPYDLDRIARWIANLFSSFLAMVVFGASFWNFGSIVLLILLGLFIIYLLTITRYVYKVVHRSEKRL